jgi:pyruvate/2-oxoglutarate dehydrogenase complex dihydrolipoamide dehydrogenase (E3) component
MKRLEQRYEHILLKTKVTKVEARPDGLAVVGQPMLAHKAIHQGKVAAEAVAGMNTYFDARAIPSVAYTDPEVAWVGVTENEARARGLRYGKGGFPWRPAAVRCHWVATKD